jgi:hypothetical protein
LDRNSPGGDNGADGDPDHDGATNAQEQITGTDPHNPSSVFRLTLTSLPSSRYGVSWRTIPGRRYQLEYSDSQVTNFAPFAGPTWPRLALSDEERYLDNTATNQPPVMQRNYRVRLVP